MAKVIYQRPGESLSRSEYPSLEEYEKAQKEKDRLFYEYAYFMQRDFRDVTEQALVEFEKMEEMKVKYIGELRHYSLISGKIYDVLCAVEGYYEIIDEKDEDHLYPIEDFEIIDNCKRSRKSI